MPIIREEDIMGALNLSSEDWDGLPERVRDALVNQYTVMTGPQPYWELTHEGAVADGTFAYTRGAAALAFLTRMGYEVGTESDSDDEEN